jgi:aldose 1-epimerase
MKAIIVNTLHNQNHFRVNILNYGAIIQSFITPEGDNLVLGFHNPEDYLANPCYLGCVVGPVANRIENAIFTIDDTRYSIEANENEQHCLHSGSHGLNTVFWDVVRSTVNSVELQYVSTSNQAGFPGTVTITITYQLTGQNELRIDYRASTDAPTIIDLTNHTYWNLNSAENVLQHTAQFNAQARLLSKHNIPTGELISVKNTAFDFQQAKLIGQDISELTETRGYDHYFVLPKQEGLQCAAIIDAPHSERRLTVHTTCPGFQFYSGNFLQGQYQPYQGFCIETQNYPNAINRANFPSPILQPSECYQQTTIYTLSEKNRRI